MNEAREKAQEWNGSEEGKNIETVGDFAWTKQGEEKQLITKRHMLREKETGWVGVIEGERGQEYDDRYFF